MPANSTRRQFLAQAVAVAASAQSASPIIDTHLEVWTFDPKFPFHHPERPDLKRVAVEARSKTKSRRCGNSACSTRC